MIVEIIELGAMPKPATEAFVKALYAILLASVKEGKQDSSVTDSLRKWGLAAQPFVKVFKLNSFDEVFKSVAKAGKAPDDDKLRELGKEIRDMFAAMHKEHDISIDKLKQIKAAGRWFRNGSDGAYKYLAKTVSSLGEGDLNQEFVKSTGSQKPIAKSLEKLVKGLTGKQGIVIPREDAAKAKKKHKELYKQYLRLRKDFNDVWKTELANYVRKSGKATVPYAEAKKYLESKGLMHNLPDGFVGRIDDQGRWYTTAGKLIAQSPGPEFKLIFMNKEYNPQTDDSFVFVARKGPKGQVKGHAHFYTVDYLKKGRTEKFENVDEMKNKIQTIRTKWLPYLKAGVKKPEGVAATILEILIQFSARVGSNPRKPNGISSLLVKNALPQANGNLILKYIGKDGVLQKHTLDKSNQFHKYCIANIKALMEGKKPNDLLFTWKKPSGKQIHINSTLVNKMYKRLGATNTVHKIRTLRGTILFDALMKKSKIFAKKDVSEKVAKIEFMRIAEEVGKMLGHVRTMQGQAKVTGATAIQSYIDPTVMLEFWNKLGMRPPAQLQKFKED